MEDNRNHIDDLLREKMQDMHFELNEQHWADAERRLDEDDKKKRPIWLLLFVVVALVGAGITALTQSGVHKSPHGISKKSPKTEQTSTQQSATDHINNEESSSNNIEEYTNNTSVPSSLNSSDDNVATNNNSTNQSSLTAFTSSKNKNTKKYSNNSVAKTTTNRNNNRNVGPKANTKQNRISNSVNNVASTNSKTKNKTSNQQSVAINSKTKPAITAPSSKIGKGVATVDSKIKDPAIVKNVKTKNPISAKSSANAKKSTDAVAMVSNKPAKTNDGKPVMLGNSRVYKTPEEYQKMNPRYVAGLENYAYTKSVISLGEEKSDSLRKVIDKQNAATANKEVKKEAKQKAPRKENIYIQEPSSFYALLGAAGARGYMGNLDATPVWGLSPELGLGYEFTFSDRMSIYLSAFMSYVSHLNIKESGSNVSYSFDKDSTLLSVTRKSLLQLSLPIELAYKVRPKHLVYGGLGINLNLNSFSLYEDSKANSNKREFGYMGGIRMFDVTANIGYEYMISKRLNLGVFYRQGFFDITKNDYFNNQHKDINARGGIRLRYKFSK